MKPDSNPVRTDLEARVTALEADPGLLDTWQETGLAEELLSQSQDLLARSASDLETGMRWKREKEDYVAAFDIYKTLLGQLAVQRTLQHLQQPDADIDAAKQDLLAFLKESKLGVVTSDIHRRLEISRVERMKERVTKTTLSRFSGRVAMAGALGAGSFGMADVVQVTAAPVIGKVTGGVMVGVLFRSQIKTMARKVKESVLSRVNGSIDFYSSPELRKIMKEEAARTGNSLDSAEIHRRLTEYHMRTGLGEIALLILESDLRNDEPVATVTELVSKSIERLEKSLDDFYGVQQKEPGGVGKLFKRLFSRRKD